jgi:hypothetical protein
MKGKFMQMELGDKQLNTSVPCFFSNLCSRPAAVEKAGRSVCFDCAARFNAREYPLRVGSIQPLYLTGRAAAEALGMLEDF